MQTTPETTTDRTAHLLALMQKGDDVDAMSRNAARLIWSALYRQSATCASIETSLKRC
jgi:hypothetical protein